eukprot:SAG11_NODE_313_length_10878_cov_43.354578_3_plen_69_part_00
MCAKNTHLFTCSFDRAKLRVFLAAPEVYENSGFYGPFSHYLCFNRTSTRYYSSRKLYCFFLKKKKKAC